MLAPTMLVARVYGGEIAPPVAEAAAPLHTGGGEAGVMSPLLILVVLVVALGAWWAGPARRWQFLREVGLIAFAYAAYSAVRSVTEGEVGEALSNARRIVRFEENVGMFWEPDLQSWIVHADWAITLVNWIYVWGHWPLIGLAAIWMWRTNITRYQLYRNAFLFSGGIGLFFYWHLPTAPPRLAGLNLLDTVAVYSDSYRVFQPPDFVNQYAAFPSLHFGWNLLIAIALVSHFRGNRWAAVVALCMPMAMLAAIVFSANHFFIDAVGGGLVALAGLGLAWLWHRRSFGPRGTDGDAPPGGRRGWIRQSSSGRSAAEPGAAPAPAASVPPAVGHAPTPQGAGAGSGALRAADPAATASRAAARPAPGRAVSSR